MKKAYCIQNDGDCGTCSLVNYGRDCQNNPITEYKYINEETKFWDHSYRVWLSEYTFVIVNADNDQDALDYAIDYAEEQNWEGLFLTDDEVKELEQEGYLEEHISGGNHGRYLSSLNVRIIQLD